MIESDRDCQDILIQLMAARSAIRSISSNMLKCHLQNCIEQCACEGEQNLDEKLANIKKLFDKLD